MSARSETPARPADFRRLLHRVHRRLVWVRVAESGGIGALAGSLIAAVLVCLLYWHGSPDVLIPVIATTTLGAAGGLLHGWNHRPPLLDAALQADRQLDLSDLLSTALLVSAQSDDAWHQSIVALADAQSVHIRPQAVLLNRFGRRAWGAISLVATLALALTFLVASTTQMRAEDTAAQARRAEERADVPADHPLLRLSADASLRRPAMPAEAEDAVESSPGESARRSNASAAESKTARQSGRGNPSETSAPSGDRGSAGSQSAKTSVDQTAVSEPLQSPGRATDRTAPAVSSLHSASGGVSQSSLPGTSKAIDEVPADAVAAHAAAARPSGPNPPWQSDQWPADLIAAQHALEADHIAPDYRDIVRDYFQPNP